MWRPAAKIPSGAWNQGAAAAAVSVQRLRLSSCICRSLGRQFLFGVAWRTCAELCLLCHQAPGVPGVSRFSRRLPAHGNWICSTSLSDGGAVQRSALRHRRHCGAHVVTQRRPGRRSCVTPVYGLLLCPSFMGCSLRGRLDVRQHLETSPEPNRRCSRPRTQTVNLNFGT